MGNAGKNAKSGQGLNHSDNVGIVSDLKRPPVEINQLDDVKQWGSRELYSINQISLLMANISPYKCTNIDSAYEKGYSDYQIERAVIMRESVLDGLFLGSLLAHKIMVNDGTGYHNEPFSIEQSDLFKYQRCEVLVDETLMMKTVLFNWIARKEYISVRQEIRNYENAQPIQTADMVQLQYAAFIHPEAPLLKEVAETQSKHWAEWKVGDKLPSQKVIVSQLTEKGYSKVKAEAIDAVASPVLRHDRSKTK